MWTPSSAMPFALIIPLVFSAPGSAASPSPPSESLAAQLNPYALSKEYKCGDDHPKDYVENHHLYHAFVLLGTETLLASHITNLCMEVHRYQFIVEISLPEPYRSQLMEERKRYPTDSFFMANLLPDDAGSASDPMNLPELAGVLRTSFKGNVWRGIPNQPEYNYWPWAGVTPLLSNIPITIKRIVHFTPFSEVMNHPDRLSYLLFGSGTEAHLVHLQTMQGREPDYDHVVSLKTAPEWLAPDLLEAGVVVDLPDKPRFGDDTDKRRGVRCETPVKDGAEIGVRYRGVDPDKRVTIDKSTWFCTRIANKPDPCVEVNERACGSETPKE